MENKYSLQDITEISKKIGWVLQLARHSWAFEDKDFYPQDIVDAFNSKFSHTDGVALTVEEVREICKIMLEFGELLVKEKDRNCFCRQRYASPLFIKFIIENAQAFQDCKNSNLQQSTSVPIPPFVLPKQNH